MTKKRILTILSIILIVVGAGIAGYPLVLKGQAMWEQHQLEKQFRDTESPYIEVDYTRPGRERPPVWHPYEPVELPQWEAFPLTKLEIPKIDVEVHVVALEDMSIFSRSISQIPSYYPESSFPGEVGNVLIAGHRGGPAGYFNYLNRLDPGDKIILHAPGISYVYLVEKVFIVEPTDLSVIQPLDYPGMTLTTCQRVGTVSSAKRLIVRAKFEEAYRN